MGKQEERRAAVLQRVEAGVLGLGETATLIGVGERQLRRLLKAIGRRECGASRFWRAQPLFEEIYGTPVDDEYWAATNPANIVVRQAQRIRDSGLAISIEAGDQDFFNLHVPRSSSTGCFGTTGYRMTITW